MFTADFILSYVNTIYYFMTIFPEGRTNQLLLIYTVIQTVCSIITNNPNKVILTMDSDRILCNLLLLFNYYDSLFENTK